MVLSGYFVAKISGVIVAATGFVVHGTGLVVGTLPGGENIRKGMMTGGNALMIAGYVIISAPI